MSTVAPTRQAGDSLTPRVRQARIATLVRRDRHHRRSIERIVDELGRLDERLRSHRSTRGEIAAVLAELRGEQRGR